MERTDRKIEGGQIYTVPAGLTVHCAWCSKVLEAGEKCFIEDDSSSIYCLKHIPAPRPRREIVVEEPVGYVPRRGHRRRVRLYE